MTDDTNQNANGDDNGAPSEDERLKLLKQRAKMMGIVHSNNISADTLSQKIEEHRNGGGNQATANKQDSLDNGDANPPPLVDPSAPKPTGPKNKREQLRARLVAENMKLVRLRITNLDPKKKDLPGEVITTGNNILGTVRKFVPFGEVTENGYHVPNIIYKMLKARKFLNIRVIKDKTGRGNDRVESNWVPEFALEVLPQLTQQELNRLGQAQLSAGNIG